MSPVCLFISLVFFFLSYLIENKKKPFQFNKQLICALFGTLFEYISYTSTYLCMRTLYNKENNIHTYIELGTIIDHTSLCSIDDDDKILLDDW